MNLSQSKRSSPQWKKPSEYKTAATAVVTLTGNYLVNYHGFCLYVNKRCVYLPWTKTREYALLVPTNEFGRLLKQNCKKFTLTMEQEMLVWQIVKQLIKNPLYGLTRAEIFIAKQGLAKREREKRNASLASEVSAKQKTEKKKVLHSFAQLRASA